MYLIGVTLVYGGPGAPEADADRLHFFGGAILLHQAWGTKISKSPRTTTNSRETFIYYVKTTPFESGFQYLARTAPTFAELVVVMWGQRTIGSRGHFGERLKVLCGRKCLPAAMGITRLTRGGQNARSYRL